MRRCLVVASQSLGGERLDEEILRRVRSGPCRFHVVVTRTASARVPSGGGDVRSGAERRLQAVLDRLHGMGVLATGEVAESTEFVDVDELVARDHYDDVISVPAPETWDLTV